MLRSWLRFHLALLLVLPPFLIGAVHLHTQAGLTALSALFLLFLGVRQSTRSEKDAQLAKGGWFWLFFAALLWTFFQYIPLPSELLAILTPEADRIYRMTLGPFKLYPSESFDLFQSISLARAETAAKLIRDIGAFSLFFGVLQWCHTRKHLQFIVRTSVAAATALIMLTFIQTIVGIKAPLLGLYKPQLYPIGILKGSPFINHNHLGGYLLFHVVLGFWLIYDAQRGKERWFWFLSVGALSIGVFASLSRGAILSYLLSLFIFFILLGKKLFSHKKSSSPMHPSASTGTDTIGRKKKKRKKKGNRSSRDPVPMWEGWERIWYNSSLRYFLLIFCILVGIGIHLTSVHLVGEFAQTKLSVNQDKLLAIRQFSEPLLNQYPLTGVGRGAMALAWPRFSTTQVFNKGQLTVTHIESQLLQPLIDWGWIFGSLYILLGGWLFWLLVRRSQGLLERTCVLAMAALLLQNVFDFNLEFAGTAFPFLAVLAGLQRIHYQRAKKVTASKWSIALPLIISVGGLVALGGLFPYANQHRLQNVPKLWTQIKAAPPKRAELLIKRLIQQHPSDFTVPLRIANRLFKADRKNIAKALKWLDIAEQINPTSVSMWMMRAQIYSELKLYRLAIKDISQAIQLRGRLLRRGTRIVEHYKFVPIALRKSRSFSLVLNLLGRWLRTNPPQKQREQILQILLKRFPLEEELHIINAQYYLGQLILGKRKTKRLDPLLLQKVQILFKQSEKASTIHKGTLFFLRGRLAQVQGKRKRAITLYERASQLPHSRQWRALTSMLQLLLKEKEYERLKGKLAQAKRTFQSNNQAAHLYFIEGKMYNAGGKYSKAITAFEEAVALSPRTHYWISLAHSCWEMSRYKCAFRIYRRLTKKPKLKYLKFTLKKWEKIYQQRQNNVHLNASKMKIDEP